jgi:hypothetical protein
MDLESTFDALYSQVARKWHQQDDIVNPFHDRRRVHIASVWTFDLDGDILRFDKKDRNLWVPLNLLRSKILRLGERPSYI